MRLDRIVLKPILMREVGLKLRAGAEQSLQDRRHLNLDMHMPPGVAATATPEMHALQSLLEGISFELETESRDLILRSGISDENLADGRRTLNHLGAKIAETIAFWGIDEYRYFKWAKHWNKPWALNFFGKAFPRQAAVRAVLRAKVRGLFTDSFLGIVGIKSKFIGVLHGAKNVKDEAAGWAKLRTSWGQVKVGEKIPTSGLNALRGGKEVAAKYGVRHLPIVRTVFTAMSIKDDWNTMMNPTRTNRPGFDESDVERVGSTATFAGDVGVLSGGTMMAAGAVLTATGVGAPVGALLLVGGLVLTESGTILQTAGLAANLGLTVKEHAGDWTRTGWRATQGAWHATGNAFHDTKKTVSSWFH